MSFTLLGILQSQAAGGGAGAFDLLETQILTSSTSSVTFSGLGSYSNYKHLHLRTLLRTDNNQTSAGARLRINGDSATNYSMHSLFGYSGGVASNSQYFSLDGGLLRAAGNTETSNSFAVNTVDILDFSSSNKGRQ